MHNSQASSHFHLKPHLCPIEYEPGTPECHALGVGLNFNSTAKLHPALLTSTLNYKIKMPLIEFCSMTLGSH